MSTLLKDLYSAKFYQNFSECAKEIIPNFDKKEFIHQIFVYFPLLIFIIAEDGGSMGFGYVVVPFILLINMFVFTALHSFKKLNQNHIGYFIVNFIGFLICISFAMFITINH